MTSTESPVLRYTPSAADLDAVFDVKVIYQQPFEQVDLSRVPGLFLPRTGPLGLTDWEKVYAAGPSAWTSADIFAERELSRDGVVVVVRPDQYVAAVLRLDAPADLASFFDRVLRPQAAPVPAGSA
jgi:phenol 2-monooxygenase